MEKATIEELNNAAMQIILHAGNSRNYCNEALQDTQNDGSYECVDQKLKSAKEEITIAHKMQTAMIQNTIEDDKLETTLLFTHAQDTLMTIYSELNMTNHLIKLYRKLEAKVK